MAYQNPTVVAAPRPSGNGGWIVTLRFTGNAGEEDVSRDLPINAGQDANEIAYRVAEIKAELDSAKTLAAAPALAIGQTIAPLTRPTPAGPTAEQIQAQRVMGDWFAYTRLEAMPNKPAALANELAAFKSDLDTRTGNVNANVKGSGNAWYWMRLANRP